MRLLTKIILISVAALTIVVGALAGIGLYVIDDATYRNNVGILRTDLNALVQDIKSIPGDGSATGRARNISRELSDFSGGTGRSYFAFRPDGTRIFPLRDTGPVFTAETVKNLVAKGGGEEWVDAPGMRYLTRYTLMSDPDLLIGVRISEEDVHSNRVKYLSAIAVAAIAMLLTGTLIAYFSVRSLTRRIRSTLEALESISGGEFGVRIPDTNANDELSLIQRQINELADSFARRAIERNAAVAWLEENEKRFRDFAETASDAFWETDADLRYTFFTNPGKDFGYLQANDSIIGKRRGGYFRDPAFYDENWKVHMQDLADRKPVQRFEFSGIYPDGRSFHRISSAIPLFDPDNTFIGYRGSTTDVTHLVEAEHRLQSVVSNLSGLVYQRLVQPDGSIEYAYLGGSLGELFGDDNQASSIAESKSLKRVHPDDRGRFLAAILESARDLKPYEFEFRHIRPDGETIWLKTVCGQPVKRADGVTVQDGLTFDITDLKNAEHDARTAEARLNDFLHAGFDVMWETDGEHRLTWMSDPIDGETRYLETDRIIGLPRWEFPGAAPAESDTWTPLMSAMNEHRPFRDFEYETVLADGRSVFRRISGRPVFSENGDFTGYRGISSNITEAVLNDRDTRARQQQLTAAIESSDQGIALFGPEDRLIFANEACRSIEAGLNDVFVPGNSFEEIVRTGVSRGHFPAAAGNEENWIRKRLAYHDDPQGAFEVVVQGGRYLEIKDERLPDGISITRITDLTDHHLDQEALRESETRFRDFAESMSDWMWETDKDHIVTWISDSVRQHSEFDISRIVGRTRWDGLGADIDNDPNWQQLKQTMDARAPIREFRFSRTRDDGKQLYRIINGVPYFNHDGDFQGYRGVVADTTMLVAAEQAERRFLEAINTANEGLILLDSEDRLVFANRKAQELLSAGDGEMTPGMSFEDMLQTFLHHEAFRTTEAEWQEWLQERLARHRNIEFDEPIVNRRSDGVTVETREEVLPDGSCIVFLNDITARMEAEEALVASQQRFQDFTKASSDWIWETDADFRITYAVGGEGSGSDLDVNAFVGRTRWEFYGVDVENDENWRNHLEDMLAHRPFRDFRFSRVGSDGNVLHRTVSGVPYYDPADGSFLGYRGTTGDITEQVETEKRYRNLIEQSPAPVMVHRDQTIVYANAAALDMFGAETLGQLLEIPAADLIHPDDRPTFIARMNAIMEDGGVTSVIEQRLQRLDGSEIVVMTRGVPVIWDGERTVLSALIDITERINAERQYRELIENAPVALTIDDGQYFLMANQAFADLFRGGYPDDIVGREIMEMAHGDDLEEFQDRVRRVSTLRQTLPIAQIRQKRFDGTTITVLTRGVPIQWQGRPATLGIQVDVSDLIAAQQALQESEERFRNLVEGSRQGVLLHTDFTPLFANAALADMFGYDSVDEILDLPSVLDLIAPESRELWRKNREARLAGLDVEDSYEFMGLHKSGKRLWIHINVRVVSWQDRTAIQGTMIDVTRRREAEIRIRESEEQFRLLAGTSPVGIFVAGPDGECEYVNEAYEIMSGQPLAQSTGRGWIDAVHPEDRENLVAGWRTAVESGNPFRTELRYLLPDGSVTWAIAQAVAQTDDSGAIVRYIGAVTNVTDRVLAEAARQEADDRFRILTTLSPVGVFQTASTGSVEYVNDALADMLGMPAETVRGGQWIKGVHPEDRDRLVEAWKAATSSREELEMEFRMGDGIGPDRWVIVQAGPLGDQERTGSYIGAVTDITDRRQAEEQLRQVQKMDAVGQLTGGIAHDFNNLLAIVQGNLELLRERAPEEERIMNLVNAAYGAAQRGAALNQRLLAFARRQPLRPAVCDINDLVGDMAGLFVRTLGDNIELRTQFAEGLWPANIDPNGLETAVLNLAINARDAMPDGGTLTINTVNRSYNADHPPPDKDIPPGDYVLLRVSDTGTGMDAETLEKAFDPFYTTKGSGKGSGLGLSMVYGFARQSNGTALVESIPGEGTSIILIFPRDGGVAERVERGDSENAPPGTGERVLIVEDDNDVRDMAIGMFESLNYRTLVAGSALEALDILNETDDVELLFTDVMLGSGDNGPELARKARQAVPGLRILFASGYARAEIEEGEPIEHGALINKPYERGDLARAVRTALDTGRA